MNTRLLSDLSRITLLITFNLSLVACGGGGDSSGEQTPVTGVTIQTMQVELIGDPFDAYDLSLEQENDSNYDPPLPILGKAKADLSNQSSEISLVDGNFYRFTVEFEENVNEFQSSIVILDLLNEQTQTVIPLYAEYEELDGTSTVYVYTLIPAEIPAGEYILVASIVDESAILTSTQKLTIDQIPQMREYGGIKVTITKNPDPDTLFVVAVQGFDGADLLEEELSFVDLYYPGDYTVSDTIFGPAEFTSEPVGGAIFTYYNTSEATKVLELSATLTLADGINYPLWLLDPSSDSGQLNQTIRLDAEHIRDDLGEMIVMYYLQDADHYQVLSKVPDLTYDISDGNLGEVTWTGRVVDANKPAESLIVPTLVAKISDVEVFDPVAVPLATSGGVKTELPFETKPIATTNYNQGLSFVKDGKYSQVLGRRELFGVEVKANYEVKGRWDLLQIDAEGSHGATFYAFNQAKPIYKVTAEAANGLKKLSPNSRTSVNRRYGSRAQVEVLDSVFYSNGIITETPILDVASAAENKALLIQNSLATVIPALTLDKTWNENTQLFTARLAGLFSAKLFVQGSMGVNMTVEFPPKVTLGAPIGLDIYGTAGADIVVAKAGLQGRVNMLNMTNEGSVGGTLKLDPNPLKDNIVFDINNKLDTQLQIIKANISAYTDCAIFCSRKTYNIYTTPWLFNKTWPVSNATVPVMPQSGGL